MTRRAQYPFTCPRCDLPVPIGAPLARVGGQYVCQRCGSGEDE